MYLKKTIWVILLVLLLTSICYADLPAKDARDIFFEYLPFVNQRVTDLVRFVLFPEAITDVQITPMLRRGGLEIACDLDLKIIEIAEGLNLPYDRTWLIFWFPKKNEITELDYARLLYFATFMPAKYRAIIDELGYEVSFAYPRYEIRDWDTQLRMNTNGFYYDFWSGEWFYNSERAEEHIIFLRNNIFTYLEDSRYAPEFMLP